MKIINKVITKCVFVFVFLLIFPSLGRAAPAQPYTYLYDEAYQHCQAFGFLCQSSQVACIQKYIGYFTLSMDPRNQNPCSLVDESGITKIYDCYLGSLMNNWDQDIKTFGFIMKGQESCGTPNPPSALALNQSGCGNLVTEPQEECDDGNFKDGDGCGARCKKEVMAPPAIPTPPAQAPSPTGPVLSNNVEASASPNSGCSLATGDGSAASCFSVLILTLSLLSMMLRRLSSLSRQ